MFKYVSCIVTARETTDRSIELGGGKSLWGVFLWFLFCCRWRGGGSYRSLTLSPPSLFYIGWVGVGW